MPRRYPAPNYLPARYLGPIVIAERDPENERKKEEETEEAGSKWDPKLRGYPAAPKSLAIPDWDNGGLRTCLRAMRTMEVRLNIDFSHAVGETKGEKRWGENHPGAPANLGRWFRNRFLIALFLTPADRFIWKR